jgi:hypothetical protein
MNFNQASAGDVIRVNFGQDISNGTVFKMIIEEQFGEAQEVTATLGTADIAVDDETYEANQYIEYTTTSATFTKNTTGRWRKKGVATLPSQTIATNYSFFRVMP